MKELTLKEVEEKLDAISQEPEKYFRDAEGKLSCSSGANSGE